MNLSRQPSGALRPSHLFRLVALVVAALVVQAMTEPKKCSDWHHHLDVIKVAWLVLEMPCWDNCHTQQLRDMVVHQAAANTHMGLVVQKSAGTHQEDFVVLVPYCNYHN